MTEIKYPPDNELRSQVRFSPRDGLILLGQNRMLLMHAAALGELRKGLIELSGDEQASRLFTRAGYAAGVRDAEIARMLSGDCSVVDAFIAGLQLQMLEGSAKVEPVRIEIDLESGRFDCEIVWTHSWEADAQIKDFGHAEGPVCSMQVAYASGYASAFMGRLIHFRETECAANGANSCRIVGKPLEDWADADQSPDHLADSAVLERLAKRREPTDTPRATTGAQQHSPSLIGASTGFQTAYGLITTAAGTCVTVLLLGQTGVGKERFARALHEMSPRAKGSFVAVNCAALPHDLIESELFGVEKGAFTGAHASRMGKFERAEGGTLFLDEVGELPLAAQAKLLRVLQEGEIERLGDERVRKVNVRLVAATNVDLQEAVKQGRFRSDLYYRLNVYPVTIPALSERSADIPLLVEAMVARFSSMHDKQLRGVTDQAMRILKSHDWPGNIRELANIIERAVILAPQHDWIGAEQLLVDGSELDSPPASIGDSGTLESGDPATPDAHALCRSLLETVGSLDQVERLLLEYAVDQSAGNLAGAARLLGITRPQLSYRLKKS